MEYYWLQLDESEGFMENAEVPKKTKWYSIREAAEYLDVGEPTLYRWMREGKITFRKVGDSTRFWQEDLDSVMQVFHSAKDLDKAREVDRKSTRLNSSHVEISYAVFCLK